MKALLLDLGRELRGGQLQVFYLARALARSEDIEPLVACPSGSPLAALLHKEDLPLLRLPGYSPANPLLLLKLAWVIRRHKISLLHSHDAKAAGVCAVFKALNRKRLLIHTRRVSYPLKSGLHLKKYLLADAVVGVSQEISDGLIQAGVPADRVFTIHSGIDVNRYRPRQPREDGRFVFVAVGALTPQKGYEVLIRAMTVLAEMEELPPWEVRIVGEGPLFDSLLQEAMSLRVDAHLAMLGRQDARLLLPDADAMVVPSVNGEGSSAAIKEGWVSGLPVICSALPSNTELVTGKEDGLVTATGNPLALAAAMARCMNEPDLCERLARRGHERVLEFTDKKMAEGYANLYLRLEHASAWQRQTTD